MDLFDISQLDGVADSAHGNQHLILSYLIAALLSKLSKYATNVKTLRTEIYCNSSQLFYRASVLLV